MDSRISERAVASRLLQYHIDLTRIKNNYSTQLASLTIIQEFLKNDKNGNISQLFMDRGLLETLLITVDSALDIQSELASLDVSLKCLWFLSQLSIGPLQRMISGDVMRCLLYLLNVNGSIYHFTSKFTRNFQLLCENKHLIGRIKTKIMSSEMHKQVHKLSNLKLKDLDMLPSNLKICSLFDTSDSDRDVNITDHLLENFKQDSWPNMIEIEETQEDEEKWEDIFVSDVIDGPLFWAHIGMSTIETVHNIKMALETANLQPARCTVGDIVVAVKTLDTKQSFYMRARVIKVDQWKVQVWALDYGYKMDIHCDLVYTLPDHLSTHKFPPQISLCKLAGVSPPPRHQVIPQLAAAILSNICQKSIPACEILAEQGGLEILETFIYLCPEPETICCVLRLITNISFHSKMSSSISNSNLTECVLDSISKFLVYPPASQKNLLVSGLNCLCNMLFKNDKARDKFYHHEGINTLMKVVFQHPNIKYKIYHAGTHLLRIFVRRIDTERSTVLHHRRTLGRHHGNSTGRSKSQDKHVDPKLKNCPNEFARMIQSLNIEEKQLKNTSFQPRMYETAWSDESDSDEDCHHVTRVSEDTDGSSRRVTTCDAAYYYGKSPDKTFILGSGVEFENDTTHELRPNKSTDKVSPSVLAKHVCGFLNSGKGGSIYIGIRNTVHGVELNRNDRDDFRLSVDRMMCDKILPCVLHSMFDVIYTPVVEHDKETDTFLPVEDLFVAEIIIKHVPNSVMYTTKDGECYYRFGAHTSLLSAQEMRQLIIVEEEDIFMEEIKQLSMELEQLKSK
ncbi:uncharacterized protein LOC132554787 [Ylistrum balloti]|uniref:uncharacterized protein LOC132554787 n=1 Tax=Ylistrum balloti TaxID=509963 RepID=UPI00290585C7|nr:uncharacterized protein LOC132554787 [Ylistrum balloti]